MVLLIELILFWLIGIAIFDLTVIFKKQLKLK